MILKMQMTLTTLKMQMTLRTQMIKMTDFMLKILSLKQPTS